MNNKELTTEFKEDGKIFKIGYTIDGKKEGEWRSFVHNRLAVITNYKKDAIHGKETWFDKCTGRIIEEGYNHLGKRIGLWYNFIDGKLVYISEYKNDESTIVYQNPKFQTDEEFPLPPPPKDIPTECEDLQDY